MEREKMNGLRGWGKALRLRRRRMTLLVMLVGPVLLLAAVASLAAHAQTAPVVTPVTTPNAAAPTPVVATPVVPTTTVPGPPVPNPAVPTPAVPGPPVPNPAVVTTPAPAPAAPGAVPGVATPAVPGAVPGTVPGAVPGVAPTAIQVLPAPAAPGAVPGTVPGAVPGAAPAQVFLPTAVPSTIPVVRVVPGTVLNNANLRSGPGTTYPVIGKANVGTVVNVTETNADRTWYHLDTGAWIAAFLVQLAPASNTAEAWNVAQGQPAGVFTGTTTLPAPAAGQAPQLNNTVVVSTVIPSDFQTATVVGVVDGATIEVQLGNGQREVVRYLNVESPSTGQPGFALAAAANQQRVNGQLVALVKEQTDRDAENRLLRHVYLPVEAWSPLFNGALAGMYMNAQMVADGLAFPTARPPDVSRLPFLDHWAVDAFFAKRGFWSPGNVSSTVANLAITGVATPLFSGPGANNGADAILTPNTVLRVLGRTQDGAWLQVRTMRGDEGWVFAPQVVANTPISRITATSEVTSGPTPQPQPGQPTVVPVGGLPPALPTAVIPGQPVPGAIPGALPTAVVPGAVPGQVVPSQPVPGALPTAAIPGQPVPGAVPGALPTAVVPGAVPGQVVPGQPVPGALPTAAIPGQPVPGQLPTVAAVDPNAVPGVAQTPIPGVPVVQNPADPVTGAQAQPTPFPGQPFTPTPFPGQPLTPTPFPGQPSVPTPFPSQPGVPTPFPGQPGVPTPFPGQPGVPTPFPGQPGFPTPFPGQPGVPTPFPGQPVAGGPTVIRLANLRTGPGTQYPLAGTALANTPIVITGRNNDGTWLHTANTTWIGASMVSGVTPTSLPEVPAPPVPTPAPSPQPTAIVVVPPGVTPPTPTIGPSPTPTATPLGNPTPTPTPLPPKANVRLIAIDRGNEWVILYNDGTARQDLTGWTLVSETGNERCELRGALAPRESLRVWSQIGPDGFSCQFPKPIWENSGPDDAVLLNALGKEVSRLK